MNQLNVKSLSLAVGIAFAVMALLTSLIFGGTIASLVDVPSALEGGGAIAVALAGIIIAFLEGVIMGALVGWVYNATATEEEWIGESRTATL